MRGALTLVGGHAQLTDLAELIAHNTGVDGARRRRPRHRDHPRVCRCASRRCPRCTRCFARSTARSLLAAAQLVDRGAHLPVAVLAGARERGVDVGSFEVRQRHDGATSHRRACRRGRPRIAGAPAVVADRAQGRDRRLATSRVVVVLRDLASARRPRRRSRCSPSAKTAPSTTRASLVVEALDDGVEDVFVASPSGVGDQRQRLASHVDVGVAECRRATSSRDEESAPSPRAARGPGVGEWVERRSLDDDVVVVARSSRSRPEEASRRSSPVALAHHVCTRPSHHLAPATSNSRSLLRPGRRVVIVVTCAPAWTVNEYAHHPG